MRSSAVVLLTMLCVLPPRSVASDVDADMALGDRAWAARAEGADDRGHARPERVAESVAAYERAVAAAPRRVDARWKLVRALYFAGEFASSDDAIREAWFVRARDAGQDAISALDEVFDGDGAPTVVASEEIAAHVPLHLRGDVAALNLWSAIAWGAWTRYGGLLEIVHTGVPAKLRRYAEVAIALDPALEHGGPHRMLAALHRSLPHVPLYTGWVDREQAFLELDRAMAIAPTFPGNRLLYALTILDLAPARRAEAIVFLEQVAALEPDPSERVEQLAMRAAARDRLAELSRAEAVGP